MDILQSLLEGITTGPFRNLLELLSLGPDRLLASLVLLAAVMTMNDLFRTAVMVEATRSVSVHLVVNVLTLWPGVMLGLILLYAAFRHPERAWINLGLAMALYLFWILGGTLTRLSRRDTEGADIGWISHGAIITVALGLLALAIFR